MGAIVIHYIVKSSGTVYRAYLTTTGQLLVGFLHGLPLTLIITAYYATKTRKTLWRDSFCLVTVQVVNTLLDN